MGPAQMGGSNAGGAGVSLFAAADRRLAWLGARQSVLAQNVANADTPGWQQRDLRPFSEVLSGSVSAAASAVIRTDPGHMSGTLDGAAAANAGPASALRGERAPDGNAVSIDDQMVKIAQNESDHEMVTAVYRKYLGMIRTAIGR